MTCARCGCEMLDRDAMQESYATGEMETWQGQYDTHHTPVRAWRYVNPPIHSAPILCQVALAAKNQREES